jgi:FemAB-related protein (PEP-CTERM system-associated)
MTESTTQWIVHPLDTQGEEGWDAFVRAQASGTFFHLSAWRRVIERAFGHDCHYLYAKRGGVIGAVLPLVQVKSRLFANALISTPFCSYGGVAAADEDAAATLIDAAKELAGELKVDYLELRNVESGGRDWPGKDLYVTFSMNINGDPDVDFKALPGKRRNMIRRGRRNGLVADATGDIDSHYALYAEMVRNLGTPVYSRRYFHALKDQFGGDCEILQVKRDDKLISSMMTFFFRDQMLVYYGGGTREARGLAANDFLYWSLIERAAERGVELVDFGRSKRGSGSFRFKELWGWNQTQLHYEYPLVNVSQMPDLSPANPKYQPLINTWKRLPVPVTRLIGPMLARSLG